MSRFFSRLPQGWQARAVFVLGAVLFVSPWVLFYSAVSPAMWDALVIGAVFMAGGALSVLYDDSVSDFTVAFLAIWLALSARILGFSASDVPNTLVWVVGPAVFLLALSSAIARASRRNAAMQSAPPSGPTVIPPGGAPPVDRAA